MNYWAMTTCALLGLGIVVFLVPLGLKLCLRANLLNRGQEFHHTHQRPVPRLGGLVLAAAFIWVEVFITIWCPETSVPPPVRRVIVLSSLAMFALGFWDDLKPLGARRKLIGQVLIAGAVCCFGLGIQTFKIPFTERLVDLHGWGALITILWLVGMANLINLIDGVDGLAGGICLMLLVLIVYVGHQGGSFELLAAGMAGATLGFLWFNFPPARIYLGDSGAYFLGFQIGLFALVNSHKGTVFAALIAPLFVLALPILDTALAILRRGLRGLPIFRPDRRHIHHRLLGMGMSRRRTVLTLYSVTLVFLVLGFAAFWSRGKLVPVLLGVGALLLMICAGKMHFSREWFSVGRVVGNSLAMRQEVQYALSLSHWLALEGGRGRSVEELWSDFTFAAQRLGFSSVKLTLADGSRLWQAADRSAPTQVSRQELHGGLWGILELEAPAGSEESSQSGEPESSPPICDPSLFAIATDLLAESWTKAISKSRMGDPTPLRFHAGPVFANNDHILISPGAVPAPAMPEAVGVLKR
jgi:UDP-GlcNAc:undecaprenyl-phosphate GlcNAc-1-phosphate transferase